LIILSNVGHLFQGSSGRIELLVWNAILVWNALLVWNPGGPGPERSAIHVFS
jgi:hypothetical protein